MARDRDALAAVVVAELVARDLAAVVAVVTIEHVAAPSSTAMRSPAAVAARVAE